MTRHDDGGSDEAAGGGAPGDRAARAARRAEGLKDQLAVGPVAVGPPVLVLPGGGAGGGEEEVSAAETEGAEPSVVARFEVRRSSSSAGPATWHRQVHRDARSATSWELAAFNFTGRPSVQTLATPDLYVLEVAAPALDPAAVRVERRRRKVKVEGAQRSRRDAGRGWFVLDWRVPADALLHDLEASSEDDVVVIEVPRSRGAHPPAEEDVPAGP